MEVRTSILLNVVFFSQMENCTDGKWRHFVDVHDLELYLSGNEKKIPKVKY